MATANVIYTRASDNADPVSVSTIAGRLYVVLQWDDPNTGFQVDGVTDPGAELTQPFKQTRAFKYLAPDTKSRVFYAGRIAFIVELTGANDFNASYAGFNGDGRDGNFSFPNAVNGSTYAFAFICSTGTPVASANMTRLSRVDANTGPLYLYGFTASQTPQIEWHGYTAGLAFGMAGTATPPPGRVLSATPAALALTGKQASIRLGHVLPVQTSNIALGTTPLRLARARRLPATPAPLTLTPRPVGVLLGHMLPVQPAALTIAAPAVRVGVGLRLAVTPAAMALTTSGAMLRAVRLLAAQATSVVVTGQAVAVRAGRRLRAEAAAIAGTGGSVALNRVGRLALAVTPAAIAVDAAAVTLRVARLLRAAPAAIGVEAQAARLALQRRLRVVPASISLLGAAVSLRLGSAAIPIPSAGRTIILVDQGSRSLLIGDAGLRRLII